MSHTTMEEELALTLAIREKLQAISPKNLATQLYRTVEPELLKLLYAKNKDLADIAYQKIRAAIYVNLDHDGPTFKELDDLLTQLLKKRQRYLKSPSKSFLSFWAEEGWAGGNYALLILPFLLSTLFPPASIALLIYTIAITVAAGIDFTRKSPEFWLEETDPATRELSEEQRDAFEKKHEDIELFLPENNKGHDTIKTIDRRAYFLYALVFVIALIGLASLIFPPVGIPVIALTVLSLVAIAATGVQCNLIFHKQAQQLSEIQYERDAPYLIKPENHNSTELISHQLPKKTTTHAPQDTPHVTPLKPTPRKPKKVVPKQEEKQEDREKEGEEGPHLHQ